CSRSREKVAMPHWRSGEVATNATESLFAVAVIKTNPFLDSFASELTGCAWLAAQPVQDVGDACGEQSDARIGGAIVQAQLTIAGKCATRKDNVGNIAGDLVAFTRADHPFVPSVEDTPRIVQVQQRQPNTIERSGGRLPHAVVDDEPAFGRLDWRWGQADLASIPPGAITCFQQHSVVAPVV